MTAWLLTGVAVVSFDASMLGAALPLAILIGLAVMSIAYAGEWLLALGNS